MTDLRLPRWRRLRHQRDFDRVYAARHRAGDAVLLIYAAEGELPDTRFGLSVSRKHGNAVRRSRLKRLMREAFRLQQHELPRGLDLVLIPRSGSDPSLSDLRKSLQDLANRLSTRDTSNESSR